jgi:hypothetical protein
MLDFTNIATKSFYKIFNALVHLTSHRIERKVAHRNASRGEGSLRWFTTEEASVAHALANLFVPSDDRTPGLDDIDVLGPPAIVLLDKILSADPCKQVDYARGLLSFDIWARQECGCNFAEMTIKDQVKLLTAAQQCYEGWTGGSTLGKTWHRLRSVTDANNGKFFAARLYPEIRSDCFRVFYTSQVSWVWLDYDGPPMDAGYPHLTPRR